MTDTARPAAPAFGVAAVAAAAPDRPALLTTRGDRTFAELDARANQLGRALRERGLREGDALALVCSNRPEFAEVLQAGQRLGLRTTPINWHLGPDEIAYIVRDCGAKAFVADERFAAACAEAASMAPDASVRLAIDGGIEGFTSYQDAIASQPADALEEQAFGGTMLYTSGTTGRPKGVYRQTRRPSGAAAGEGALFATLGYRGGEDVHLCTGPLYHAAPLAFSLAVPLALGVTTVVMDGWSPEECLAAIERHRVTHTHMVPTMFHRLVSLPDDVRSRYDVSSLRHVLHGAAPCPVETKRRLIEWLGPVVWEYYAATEGWGTLVGSEEWLERPGTVGRPEAATIEIRGDDGAAVPAGEVGTVFIKAPDELDTRFEYYKDPDKTAGAYRGDWFTLRDMGYVDEDGYLYLTDRTADLIISGGVNIYPAEVDAVLLQHPAVLDSCTVGIPNEEWGEEVRGVVQLRDGFEASGELGAELVAFCRERLAHFKCPRAVDFTDELPRHETGKLYRRFVRERYRGGS